MSKIHGVIEGVLQKECALCHKVKPVETEFFKAARGLYGRHNYCKDCCRLHNAKRKGQTAKEPLDLTVCSRPGCGKPPRNRFERYCSKKCGRHVRDFFKRRNQKARAVQFAGGKCSRCDYDKSVAALNFHHRDPLQKAFLISHKILPWAHVLEEISKCDLLCANCHREVHALEDRKIWIDTETERTIWNRRSYEQSFRRKQKERMLAYKGGACQICGYNTFPEALAFHHRDPAQKEFNPSQKKISIVKLYDELDKCDLLCFNCHAEIHFNAHAYAKVNVE